MAKQNDKVKHYQQRLAEIRKEFGNYVRSEGCDCCRDIEGHKAAAKKLASLLRVKKYSDGSGFNFMSYSDNPID